MVMVDIGAYGFVWVLNHCGWRGSGVFGMYPKFFSLTEQRRFYCKIQNDVNESPVV